MIQKIQVKNSSWNIKVEILSWNIKLKYWIRNLIEILKLKHFIER
jgi:hypothetical protein